MNHRTVADLMTHMVVRVHRDTPFQQIAALLDEHAITAVPVVDPGDQPVGIVSEADLLRSQADRPDPSGRSDAPARPAHRRTNPDHRRTKREATTAQELMSSPVVCARPEWNVTEAARVMLDRSVKRLPVVDEAGRLVGIVSRGDLMRVFLRRDSAIRDEIIKDVLIRTMRESPSAVRVDVDNGMVVLTGSVARASLVPMLVGLCQSVDGVVHVEHHLHSEHDDLADTSTYASVGTETTGT
ncbi:CBS domain-containing protein [Streptomyces sp. RB6PN25]|uniref:CBS domain-containing protein n=1 Tax=Streptomyces humicola TaxID=2953240 RepID=A0ABT1Q4J4_9ACTN|nr:CBS domain-containing protein [Streptomyces humicola]MCQ4084810.1 CBS domain-containing protein [Streptomyces humicola]